MQSIGYIDQHARSNWIRLRTLVTVRWFAIGGQGVALLLAGQLYHIQVPMVPCVLAIALSLFGNIIAIAAYPDNRRLSETETVFMLLFDILQLCFLLALTGGLNNPFAVLILAPVTIAATVLPTRLTVFLGSVAVFLISFVATFHIPLYTRDGTVLVMPGVFAFGFWVAIVLAIAFIAIYTRRITAEMTSMAEALLATQMALAREQKLTDLGGVVAATAHELGTPLATIKLVSTELTEDLKGQGSLQEDAILIGQQADRCRDILHSMGQAGKDDTHLRTAPLRAVVEEAANPHMDRGKAVIFDVAGDSPQDPITLDPIIRRQPEVIHGLRNLIQNAVDFADEAAWVAVWWSPTQIGVRITDDGKGFAPQVLGRLGEPFLSRRPAHQQTTRTAYEGMGLGLFIAKTLLERSGAVIRFSNSQDLAPPPNEPNRGARVEVVWDRSKIEISPFEREF